MHFAAESCRISRKVYPRITFLWIFAQNKSGKILCSRMEKRLFRRWACLNPQWPEASAVVGVVNSVNDPDTVLKDFIHKHITRPAMANDAMPEQDPVFKLAGVAPDYAARLVSVINSLRQLCIKLKVRQELAEKEKAVWRRGTPDRTYQFSECPYSVGGHSESRKTVEQQITSLLTLPQKNQQIMPDSSNYCGNVWMCWNGKINFIAARMHLLAAFTDEACTEAALSNFMQANGAALTSALVPFLKGRGGVDVASRYITQCSGSPAGNNTAWNCRGLSWDPRRTGLMPDPGWFVIAVGSYTPAQHLRFQQRLNDINDIQEWY